MMGLYSCIHPNHPILRGGTLTSSDSPQTPLLLEKNELIFWHLFASCCRRQSRKRCSFVSANQEIARSFLLELPTISESQLIFCLLTRTTVARQWNFLVSSVNAFWKVALCQNRSWNNVVAFVSTRMSWWKCICQQQFNKHINIICQLLQGYLDTNSGSTVPVNYIYFT